VPCPSTSFVSFFAPHLCMLAMPGPPRSFFLEHRIRSTAAVFKLRPPHRSPYVSPSLRPRLVCVVRTPPPPLISCTPSRSTGTDMPGLATPPPSVASFTRSQSHPLEPVVEFAFFPALCRCFSRRVWWPGSHFCVHRRNSSLLPARSYRASPPTALRAPSPSSFNL
jgi:hypothetical protein